MCKLKPITVRQLYQLASCWCRHYYKVLAMIGFCTIAPQSVASNEPTIEKMIDFCTGTTTTLEVARETLIGSGWTLTDVALTDVIKMNDESDAKNIALISSVISTIGVATVSDPTDPDIVSKSIFLILSLINHTFDLDSSTTEYYEKFGVEINNQKQNYFDAQWSIFSYDDANLVLIITSEEIFCLTVGSSWILNVADENISPNISSQSMDAIRWRNAKIGTSSYSDALINVEYFLKHFPDETNKKNYTRLEYEYFLKAFIHEAIIVIPSPYSLER